MLTIYLQIIENDEEKSKFETIYLTYKNLMLNRSYGILKDRGLTEDAVHNAFLRILKNLNKIHDVKSKQTKAFVVIIAENEAKRIYNKEHKMVFMDLSDDIIETGFEQSVEDNYNVADIKNRINHLPDIYSDVLILKYFNEFSDKEIASALSISLSTVRKRLLRGKRMLLADLKEGV